MSWLDCALDMSIKSQLSNHDMNFVLKMSCVNIAHIGGWMRLFSAECLNISAGICAVLNVVCCAVEGIA